MFRSYRFWGTLLGLLLAAGCRTVPARLSAKAAPAAEPVHRLPADPPLDRVAEAHAHYAAGVLHEMNQEPEEALKEFYQAALRDPDNESLVLEVARRFQQEKEYDKALELLTRAAARPNASGA